jgi:regulator of replication initiation timing
MQAADANEFFFKTAAEAKEIGKELSANVDRLQEENEQLKAENERLRVENRRLRERPLDTGQNVNDLLAVVSSVQG